MIRSTIVTIKADLGIVSAVLWTAFRKRRRDERALDPSRRRRARVRHRDHGLVDLCEGNARRSEGQSERRDPGRQRSLGRAHLAGRPLKVPRQRRCLARERRQIQTLRHPRRASTKFDIYVGEITIAGSVKGTATHRQLRLSHRRSLTRSGHSHRPATLHGPGLQRPASLERRGVATLTSGNAIECLIARPSLASRTYAADGTHGSGSSAARRAPADCINMGGSRGSGISQLRHSGLLDCDCSFKAMSKIRQSHKWIVLLFVVAILVVAIIGSGLASSHSATTPNTALRTSGSVLSPAYARSVGFSKTYRVGSKGSDGTALGLVDISIVGASRGRMEPCRRSSLRSSSVTSSPWLAGATSHRRSGRRFRHLRGVGPPLDAPGRRRRRDQGRSDHRRTGRAGPAAPANRRLEMENEILRRAAAYFAKDALPK